MAPAMVWVSVPSKALEPPFDIAPWAPGQSAPQGRAGDG
jgi:hypothetical protein